MKDSKYYTVKTENFPLLLGSSRYRPKTLYAMGTLPFPTSPTGRTSATDKNEPVGIAMVGTRRPSNSAAELCRKLVDSLRGTNAVIVSGLAQGIDSLCHEAALQVGLPTIGVLAQGLDTHIEGSRGDLARRILDAGGALVSTFEPDEPAYKGNFVARNKIICGMSAATLVVQSKIKGGALITADFCRKEDKPLLAVPGDFDSEVASGTNQLLDDGLAKPVFRPESLRQMLGLPTAGGQSLKQLQTLGCSLGTDAALLFSKVNGYKKTFTDLQSEFDFNTNQLLAILTELEIAGLAHTSDNFMFHFNGAE